MIMCLFELFLCVADLLWCCVCFVCDLVGVYLVLVSSVMVVVRCKFFVTLVRSGV